MASEGGGPRIPPPVPPEIDAFKNLITALGKKPANLGLSKFVKKMTEIPEVSLLASRPCRIALNLTERCLIGQFTGLWPLPKATEAWMNRNWKPLIKESVSSFFVGKGYFVFVFESKQDKELIFRNGPYFMGPQGLHLNKWSPDFDPSQDVP